jgi:outer membrane scaffolding protein for murein synthesis (MipA/OmpV family)
MKKLSIALLVALICGAAQARPLPLWEFGMSLTLLEHPDYRGSRHYGFTPLPLPYFVYRGDRLRITREGVRAKLLERNHLRIDMSVAASLPNSGKNEGTAREGMPRLLPTFEVGPSLDYWFTDETPGEVQVRLRTPIRAVAGFNVTHSRRVGFVLYPHLQVDRNFSEGPWNLQWSFGAGPLWADNGYHDYFYNVDPQYATPTRPAYDSRGGYSGSRAGAFFSAGQGRWRVGAGVTDDWLDGAVFRASPLVERRNGIVAGVYVTYRIFGSKEMVGAEVTP